MVFREGDAFQWERRLMAYDYISTGKSFASLMLSGLLIF